MNNIFKIIWNKTTQRLEVVSELAKGAVKASSSTQTKTVITKQLFKLTVLSVCLNYSNLSIAAEKIIVNGINFNDKLIAIGGDGGDDRNQKGVQVGNYAGIPGNKQIAIGHDHIVAAGNNSILIGSNYNSRPGGTTGVNTIAIGPGAQAIGRNTLTLGANSGSGSGYNGYDDAVFLGSHSRISSKGQGQTQTDEELKALEKTYTDAVVTYNKSGTDTNLNKVIAAGKAINNVALNKVDAMTIKSNSNTNNKFNVTESTITPLNESKDKTTVSILSIGGENGDNKMYRQIQNVAAGRMSADSFDAVNGSQLYYVRNYTGWNIGHNSNNQETVTGRVNNDHTVIFKANDNYVNVSTTLDSTNKSTVNIGVNTSDISVTKDNGRITAVAANNPTNTVETNTVATATSVRTALNAFNEVKADKNTKFTINAGNDKVKDLTLGNDGTVNFKAEDGLEVEAKNDAVVYKLNAESKQSIADAKAAATTVTNKLNEINQSVKRAETAAGKAEAAKTAAETAKAGAESAKTAAVTAQGKAEAAQGKAEAAQGKAESARDEAITAKDAAVTAQGEAEKAQGKAEAAQGKAEEAQDKAESARDEAITAKDAAVTAQGEAEKAQGKAEAARDEAITAKDAAVTAQGEAEKAQGKAEAARDEAITAKDAAVTAQGEAEKAQGKAEAAQGKAEAAQGKAESARDEAITAKDSAKASEDKAKAIETRIENSGLISKDGKTAFAADNTSGRNSAKASGKDSTAMGYGSEAKGDHSTALGNNAKAHAERSTAIGHNAEAKAAGSVALGEGSVAKEENTVSVGDIGHERRITNVQDPKNLTDAANKRYVDNSISSVRSELKQTDRKLRGGIAGAVAMANIPTVNRAGGTMVGIGVGSFKGQSAVAVGINRASDSNRVHFKMSGSATTSGDYAVGAGMGYQWQLIISL